MRVIDIYRKNPTSIISFRYNVINSQRDKDEFMDYLYYDVSHFYVSPVDNTAFIYLSSPPEKIIQEVVCDCFTNNVFDEEKALQAGLLWHIDADADVIRYSFTWKDKHYVKYVWFDDLED